MNDIKLIMYSADLSSELPLPFADQGVKAGFPSSAALHQPHHPLAGTY